MGKEWKKKITASVCLLLVIILTTSGLLVYAKKAVDTITLGHHHSDACLGEATRVQEADGDTSLLTINEYTCPDCGAVVNDYRFIANCSCGEKWERYGHACFNSPKGSNPDGGCSNYKEIDFDTEHEHKYVTYTCQKEEGDALGTVKVLMSETDPAREVTLTAEYGGTLSDVDLVWDTDGDVKSRADRSESDSLYHKNSSITTEENGNFRLRILYAEDGVRYEESRSYAVGNIDRENPEVTLSMNPANWQEGDCVVRAEAKDNGLGLAEDAYSFDGGESWSSIGEIMISDTTVVEVIVKDKAGNTAKASVKAVNRGAEEARQKAAEEARKKAEEEARRKAEEEAKKKAEEEAKKKAEEEAKKKAEEEAKKKAEEEAKKKAEEEAKKKAEEETKKKAEEEAKKKAEEEAKKKAEEEAKKKAEEEAKKKAEEEAKKKAEEEAKKKAEEEAKKKAEEEAKKKAEEEAKKKAEEEAKKRAEEEAFTEEEEGRVLPVVTDPALEEMKRREEAEQRRAEEAVRRAEMRRNLEELRKRAAQEIKKAEEAGRKEEEERLAKLKNTDSENIPAPEDSNANRTDSIDTDIDNNNPYLAMLHPKNMAVRMLKVKEYIEELPTQTKVISVSVGTIIGVTGIVYALYIFVGTAGIFWIDNKGRKRSLGRLAIRRMSTGFEMTIGTNTIQNAQTGNIYIRMPFHFANLYRYQPLQVHYKDNMYSLHVERDIRIRIGG